MLRRNAYAAWILLAALFLGGCATTTDPRFQTETPSEKITGEAVCEVPQHWKALALEGVDTRSLSKAAIVQVRIPAEWLGDALGWFVESADDSRAFQHYPRQVWMALASGGPTGTEQFFPAIMKNPLINPYLTVIISDPKVKPGEKLQVYVLSGAYSRLLTVDGDRLLVPTQGKDCLKMVDAEFIRSFPSPVAVRSASAKLLASVRADFPTPTLQSDGKVYSLSPKAFNKQVMGDTRQVTRNERTAERGATIVVNPLSPVPTIISGAVNLGMHLLSEERYVGPFGERQYSAPEARAALVNMTRGYNHLKRELELVARVPNSGDLSLQLDFEGRKSGWEIGELLALQVEDAWRVLERLQSRVQRLSTTKQ